MQINTATTSFFTPQFPTNKQEQTQNTSESLTNAPKDSMQNEQNLIKPHQKLQSTQDITQIPESQQLNTQESLLSNPHPGRITYGLRILELMSDEEYRAFLYASEGLSESQKMLMAQSLYRFTDLYQGRKEIESTQNDAAQNNYQLKAFGIESSQIQSFLNRYKNAYAQIMNDTYTNF